MKSTFMPQEIEVFYVIPTVRKYIAYYLIEKGLKQKAIAKILSVRESTISQYKNLKRAAQIDFNNEIKDYIKKSSEKIKTSFDLLIATQNILRKIRENGCLCEIHKQICNEIPSDCNPNKVGCNFKEAIYDVRTNP